MNELGRVTVFGCGFTGTCVARLALGRGLTVAATTRDGERARALRALGIEADALTELSPRAVRDRVDARTAVLLAFPPDGRTDAVIASELGRAARVVYLSSTAVYGAASGRIDEETPVDSGDARAGARLAGEQAYVREGAAVVRAAGIYGPFRGLHRRLASGTLRVAEGATNVVSRIHVTDLSRIVLGLFDTAAPLARGAVFLAADDTPVPQIEVIRWLCNRLRLPLPAPVAPSEVAPSLRHDRAVDNARIKRTLALALQYPSYREGFEACWAAEASGERP